MRRDVLLLEQLIEAADQAVALVEGVAIQDLAADRIRRDALPWNFAVLGEASALLSAEVKEQFADVPWRQPGLGPFGPCWAVEVDWRAARPHGVSNTC